MKFIKTYTGDYINVNYVKGFYVEYSQRAREFFIAMELDAEEDADFDFYDTQEAAQAALDELMKEINGG